MHPIECPLHVRQTRAQLSYNVFIGCYSEPYAFDRSSKWAIWLGQNIYFGRHTRSNVLQLGLTEVRHNPPGSGVDQRKDLLTRTGISSLGDREVRDAGVERRIDATVV